MGITQIFYDDYSLHRFKEVDEPPFEKVPGIILIGL